LGGRGISAKTTDAKAGVCPTQDSTKGSVSTRSCCGSKKGIAERVSTLQI